jgi:hypothetical protein
MKVNRHLYEELVQADDVERGDLLVDSLGDWMLVTRIWNEELFVTCDGLMPGATMRRIRVNKYQDVLRMRKPVTLEELQALNQERKAQQHG